MSKKERISHFQNLSVRIDNNINFNFKNSIFNLKSVRTKDFTNETNGFYSTRGSKSRSRSNVLSLHTNELKQTQFNFPELTKNPKGQMNEYDVPSLVNEINLLKGKVKLIPNARY